MNHSYSKRSHSPRNIRVAPGTDSVSKDLLPFSAVPESQASTPMISGKTDQKLAEAANRPERVA